MLSATATRIATLGRLVSQALSLRVLRAAEDRGFEPRRVVTPNRISSSGRGRPESFKLDQRPWPVPPEPQRHHGELQPKLQPWPRIDGLCGVIRWGLRVPAGSRWGTDEQAPVGPPGSRIVLFEFEADSCGAASRMAASMSVTPICQVSTLGGSLSAAALDAEMHRFGSEADELRVLRALVDDRQAEPLVEGALGGRSRTFSTGASLVNRSGASWLMAGSYPRQTLLCCPTSRPMSAPRTAVSI